MSASHTRARSAELEKILEKLSRGPTFRSDLDALDLLICVGRLLGTVRGAIDYEMGRIKAGLRRSSAAVVLADANLPAEARKEIAKSLSHIPAPKVRQRFEQAGRGRGTPDQERSLLITIIEAVAHGAKNDRLKNLAEALRALDIGESRALLAPKPLGGGRGGHGHPELITNHRKRAVLGITYQHHCGGFPSAKAAREKIASFYGMTADAMAKWPGLVRRAIGDDALNEEIQMVATFGLCIQFSKHRSWSLPPGFSEGMEKAFGLDGLRADGKRFQKLRNHPTHSGRLGK